MDLSNIDPNLFLYSVVIGLNIRECLFCRLNRLGRLDISSVLLPVPVIVAVIESFSPGLIVVTRLSVLVILPVAAVLGTLGTLGTVTAVLPALILTAGILSVRIIPVAVSVIPVTVTVGIIPVAAVIMSVILRSCCLCILSHQISPYSILPVDYILLSVKLQLRGPKSLTSLSSGTGPLYIPISFNGTSTNARSYILG